MAEPPMARTQEDFNNYVAGELRAGDLRMSELMSRITEIETRHATMGGQIDQTARDVSGIKKDTEDMLATFRSWQGAMRSLEMLGRLAKPLGYIATLAAAVAGTWAAIKGGAGPRP